MLPVRWQNDLLNYSIAGLATLAALGVQLALHTVLDDSTALLLFLAAVVFSAWLGGLRPAIFSLVFGILLGDYFFLEPIYSLAVRDTDERIIVAVYMALALPVALLIEGLHRSRRRAEKMATEASEKSDALAREVRVRTLAEQKLQAEERLLKRLMDIQERERRLVCYEVHDGLLQGVISAKLLVDVAIRSGATAPRDELRQSRDLLEKSIEEGRKLIGNLRPMVMDERGILEALRFLVAEERLKDSGDIRFTHDVTFDRLPPLLESNLFRIAHEALLNVRRHSRATTTEVRLEQNDDRIRLEIADDGVGFDPAQVAEDHFGVQGIFERARLFGGKAVIDSAPGSGTRVSVEMPIG